MTWERIWILFSGLLMVVAAFFLWRNNLSTAFVIAALGACAWFLSYRSQLRKKISAEESDDAEDDHESDAT